MIDDRIDLALKEFISAELMIDAGAEVEVDDNLLLDGLIDSLGAIRLVDFVERTWGVTVPAQDVTVDNFGSIELISRYVRQLESDEGPG